MRQKPIAGIGIAAAILAFSTVLLISALVLKNVGFWPMSKWISKAAKERLEPRITSENTRSGDSARSGKKSEGRPEKDALADRESEYRKKLNAIAHKHLRSEVERGDAGSKIVALTFDAGAASDSTPQILDVLRKRNVKVTFFLTGKWVEQNPKLAKRIAEEGHELGNHTYSHPKLTSMSEAEVLEELLKAEKIIKQATGEDPRPFFRAPFGARDQRILDIVAKRGYFSVYWTADSFDWKEGIADNEVRDRVFSVISPGAIILSHAGSSVEARVLPSVLDEIEKRGYKAGKLSDVLRR